MPFVPLFRRGGAALAVVPALLAPFLTTGTATAAPAGAHGSTAMPRVRVVLNLRPRVSAHMVLAGSQGRSPAARIAALNAAAPSSQARTTTSGWLSAHGLHVIDAGTWGVVADAPADVAAAAFGVSAVRTPDGHIAHTGTLRIPAALGASVDAVVGIDTRPVLHRLSIVDQNGNAVPGYTGGDLRAAYHAPTTTTPPADGTGTSIGTLQFSQWTPSDLTTYATSNRPTPLPTTLPTWVYVGQSTDPGQVSGDPTADGGVEVALDQETIRAVAPQATQYIYGDPDGLDPDVMMTALNGILTDIQNGRQLTALSSSWGACESAFGAAAVSAMNDTLALITAGGPTVFAATGDFGSHDCYNPNLPDTSGPADVDFPASSPYVVAVGGTSLAKSSSGTFSERAWGPADQQSGVVEGGGGGVSGTFARPAWQQSVPTWSANRMVPDIASSADPDEGFAMYDGGACAGSDWPGWCFGGGTSLASPTQAALLVASLSSLPHPAGIGDIHSLLYANPSSMSDVRSGTNGTQVAGPGYDMTTGLGSPNWSKLVAHLTDVSVVGPRSVAPSSGQISVPLSVGGLGLASGKSTVGQAVDVTGGGSPASCTTGTLQTLTGPTPTLNATVSGTAGTKTISVAVLNGTTCDAFTWSVDVDGTAPTSTLTASRYTSWPVVRVAWNATDNSAAGIARYDVQMRRASDGHLVWSQLIDQPRVVTVTPPSGTGYVVSVRAQDAAGNWGPRVVTPEVVVPLDDRAASRTGSWTYVRTASAFSHSLSASAARGSAISATLTGKSARVYFARTAYSGYAYVYLDGRYVRTINLYSYRSSYAGLQLWSSSTAQTHTVKVVASGSKPSYSRAARVYVDSFLAG